MMCLNSVVQLRAESSTTFYLSLSLPSVACTAIIIYGYFSAIIPLNTLLQTVMRASVANRTEKPEIKIQNECAVGQVSQSLALDLCTPSLYGNQIEDD